MKPPGPIDRYCISGAERLSGAGCGVAGVSGAALGASALGTGRDAAANGAGFFASFSSPVWAPAITTLLYLAIFTVALGRGGRTVMGVPFADFIGPGLIVMAMLQNAFANSSFSLLVGKIQGNIVDYLMPPLSTGELIAGLVGASVTRAFFVGFAVWLVMLFWPGVSVAVSRPELVVWFGLLGAMWRRLLGLFTSILG